MKRKLMCLLLAFVMAFSCFAAVGCSSKDGDETVEGGTTDEAALTTATLTLWIPTDKNTTEEAILAVQEAMNKILKAKYETAIELHAIPSDEYEAAIDARLTEIEEKIAFEEAEAERKRQEAKELAAQGITTAAEEETTADTTDTAEEETYVNDLGMTVLRYPEVEETQMDIFLVRGYDNYKSYIEREALSALDSELSSSSKILKQYIYPSFLTYAKVDGSVYAIPNNHVIGEYKYLLINKRLVDELYWDPDSLTSLLKCEDFIMDVKQFTDVTPMLSPVEAPGMTYWSEDGSWSLLASQVTNDIAYNTYCPPKNVLTIRNYVDTYSLMKRLSENDCFAADPSKVEEFGVGILSGDASLPAQYEDEYYVSVYESPTLTTGDVYDAMFAVSSYTKSLSRSMQILTMLNTDTELRTILQYGVEDMHWRKNDQDSSVIDIISKDYKMNLLETGNVYMTYPGEGISMEYWETAKKQNLASKVSPFLAFEHKDYYTDDTKEDFKALAELSKEYADTIGAMTSAEFDEIVSDMKKEVNAIELIAKMVNAEGENTPASLYFAYHDAKPK
ncbi:MAG: hypothetical protein ACI3XP_04185 [Eubacteriales bacterium]